MEQKLFRILMSEETPEKEIVRSIYVVTSGYTEEDEYSNAVSIARRKAGGRCTSLSAQMVAKEGNLWSSQLSSLEINKETDV